MKPAKWLLLILFFAIVPHLADAQTTIAEKYLDRCKTYLIKDDTLYNWLKFSNEGVFMYADPALASDTTFECFIPWPEVAAFNALAATVSKDSLLRWYATRANSLSPVPRAQGTNRSAFAPTPTRPLRGLRIALDPGHVGGTMEMGQMEWKFVKIKPDPAKGIKDTVAFNEGNLALGTAILLDSLFTQAGAVVLKTRNREGETAFGYSFEAWLDTMQVQWERISGKSYRGSIHDAKAWERYRIRCAAEIFLRNFPEFEKDRQWWMNKSSMVSIYKTPFLKAEFNQRAAMIHDFKPDLTLIIHYNVLETNEPDQAGFRAAVPDNYCMTFVPGGFMKGELGTAEDRLAFLVKLLGEEQSSSVNLCERVLSQHVKLLEVPVVPQDAPLGYLQKASTLMPGTVGVYARNLALTRKINGVMCFGESLYQDNIKECQALNQKDFVLDGMTTPMPNRIKTVADAYYQAVLEYAQTLKK